MSDALIGHTGFVGGNLAAQHRFDAVFNSKTIESVRGRHFRRLVVSAMPAEMWVANRDPDGDRANLEKLWANLSQCRADEVAVISTVAVYATPIAVDEDTVIEPNFATTYGRHRLELERRARWHFPRVVAVRLPGLYGPGLKKNAVYDLLHDNQVNKLHAGASYQFYDTTRVWCDVEVALASGLRVVNLATEPVTVRDVARAAFGRDFTNDPGTRPACFDVRTKHAALFGGRDGYIETRAQVLAGLSRFVASERVAAPRLAA
ncbi:NAD(P)-dependent oxidoreductase [bacterium]|nr:NAD(P)-dependent oxidoreductase [bacterium]